MLNLLKGKDIVLGILGDFYAWALYGTDIKDVKDLDLAVTITTDVIAETLIKAIAGENDAYAFNIAHDGALGLTAKNFPNITPKTGILDESYVSRIPNFPTQEERNTLELNKLKKIFLSWPKSTL